MIIKSIYQSIKEQNHCEHGVDSVDSVTEESFMGSWEEVASVVVSCPSFSSSSIMITGSSSFSPTSFPLLTRTPLCARREFAGMKATGTTKDSIASKSTFELTSACLRNRPKFKMFLTTSRVLLREGTISKTEELGFLVVVTDSIVVVTEGVVGCSNS